MNRHNNVFEKLVLVLVLVFSMSLRLYGDQAIEYMKAIQDFRTELRKTVAVLIVKFEATPDGGLITRNIGMLWGDKGDLPDPPLFPVLDRKSFNRTDLTLYGGMAGSVAIFLITPSQIDPAASNVHCTSINDDSIDFGRGLLDVSIKLKLQDVITELANERIRRRQLNK